MKILPRFLALIFALIVGPEARAIIGTAFQAQLGNPSAAAADATQRDNFLLARPQYVLGYNNAAREPNWVSWNFTPADRGPADRTDAFAADPALPAGFVVIDENSYRNSGYDRGHMCPSADRTATVADNEATFYMTNIVPQSPDNNQGPWARFEDDCRRFADLGNELLIISGPSGFNGTAIASGVAIPGFVWKIAVVVPNGPGPARDRITAATRVIAIKMPNVAGIRSTPWQNFVTSAGQIERETGLTFFGEVPPAIGAALRAKVDGQADTGTAPTITRQPAAAAAVVGGSVSFSIVATGEPAPTVQWFRDGTAIPGATSATLALGGITLAQAGQYTATVSNSAGIATSKAALLGVFRRSYAGVYFSSAPTNGSFALVINDDHSGYFLGYRIIEPFLGDLIAGGHNGGFETYVGRTVTVDADGRIRIVASHTTSISPAGFTSIPDPQDPRRLISIPRTGPPSIGDLSDVGFAGTMADDGQWAVTAFGESTINGTRAGETGPAAAFAGYYTGGVALSSGQLFAIIGSAGQALVLTRTSTAMDHVAGNVDPSGRMTSGTTTVTLAGNTIDARFGPAGSATFVGARARSATLAQQRLVNVSSRAIVQVGNEVIAGFVITGLESKPVLVRAIGPGLREFGVTGVATNPALTLRTAPPASAIPTATNAADLTAAARRVGAFPAASGDAAVMAMLAPGNYTATVGVGNGGGGECLIEVYDLSASSSDQRLVNLSTRGAVSAATSPLTAGVVVQGSLPKRVLIRAAGPTLTPFGVSGALARPELTLFSGSTVIATNAGWDRVDRALLQLAVQQAGAFAFAPGSADAALIVNLLPGAYTAQVAGADGGSGVALLEIYELP